MNKKHTKNAKSPIFGCSAVQQVHILYLLRVIARVKGTRSLTTPGLCHRGPRPKHREVVEAPCLWVVVPKRHFFLEPEEKLYFYR